MLPRIGVRAMTPSDIAATATGGQLISRAAVSKRRLSATGMLERLFAFAFRGLVYPQIWEDPVCDMRGLAIEPGQHVVTIASGGCNALSYLAADPARITAIDLNTAHVALGRLKLAAARSLPDHTHFRRMFADADKAGNVDSYNRWIAPRLDAKSRAYWEGRDHFGRRRISMFARGLYRHGLLGNFIAAAHLLARLHGVDPRVLLEARDREEQTRLFEERLMPLFERPLIRWLTGNPASLFGLGIPPAQYEKLAGGKRVVNVLQERLRKLCCNFDLRSNYFAWQALGRSYANGPDASLPPYLMPDNFEQLRARSERVELVQASMTGWLAERDAASIDRYVFLDAQDWMTDQQIDALWSQVCRTARPGARVLFRTAAEPDLLPGRLDPGLLEMWDYRADLSAEMTASDRSSIYGGVHLYRRRD